MKKKNACMLYRINDKDFIERLSSGAPYPDKDKIVEYLLSGELYGQTSVQDKVAGRGRGTSLWTDGQWVWDDILIEFVNRKNLKIGNCFLQHMKDNNWTVPEIDLTDPKTYE